MSPIADQDLAIRHFIYMHIVDYQRPPTPAETAIRFNITSSEAEAAYRRLHEHHAIFLQPDSIEVRIANPFSGIPTPFRVYAGQHMYYANCSWDSLGIPAALHSDARIEATCAESKRAIQLNIENGELRGDTSTVYFALPIKHWYDDLIFT